jgi:hypothetical protein
MDSIGVALAPFGFLNPVVARFICVAFNWGLILNSTKKITAGIG